MNILLLGNGFDLHHDLPTKYENFLHTMQIFHTHYNEFLPLTLSKVFEKVKHNQNDKIIANSYDKYQDIYEELTISLEEYEKIQSLKNNYWYKYFSKVFDDDIGWIDFEKEINNVISAFNIWFKSFNASSNDNNYVMFSLNGNSNVDRIIHNFNFFYVATYKDNTSDDGNVYGFKFISEAYSNDRNKKLGIITLDEEKIADKLFSELEILSDVIKLYLNLFVENLINHKSFKKKCNANDNYFKGFDEIITFNYTNTYKRLYNPNIHKQHSIHGNVNGNIVLGINSNKFDECYDMNTVFIRFKKYYQRVILSTDNSYNAFTHRLNEFKDPFHRTLDGDKSVRVCVFGHSLDVTDEDVIRFLFSKADSIVIYYYDDTDLKSKVSNLVNIYGRKEFDEIRYQTRMTFKLIE